MIARIWHGWCPTTAHADAYEAMLKPELLPGLSKVPGYRGGYLLRRSNGDEIEFVTILIWDSLEAIKAVAGPDYERAMVPEERRTHLVRWDEKARHFDVAALQGAPIG